MPSSERPSTDRSTECPIDTGLDALHERLDRLERANAGAHRSMRLWRRVAVAGLLFGAAGVHFAATVPTPVVDVLRARRFELIDTDDNVLFMAFNGPHGAQLDFWDTKGRNTVRIASNEFGGDMQLWNADGGATAGIYATEAGGRLDVANAAGAPAISARSSGATGVVEAFGADAVQARLDAIDGGVLDLGSADGGHARLAVRDGGALELRTGVEREGIELRSRAGGGTIEARRADGVAAASIGAADGTAGVRIAGGGATAQLVSSSNGVALSGTHDVRGVFQLGTNEDGIGLRLGNGDGEERARLAIDDDDLARLTITDEDEAASVLTSTTVGLSAADGRAAMLEASPGSDRGGQLRLFGAAGVETAAMRSRADDTGTLVISESGEPRLVAEAIVGGGSGLSLQYSVTRMLVLAARASGGVLNLADGDGDVVVATSAAEDAEGGAFELRNGDGVAVVRGAPDPRGRGTVSVYNAAGTEKRVVRPD